MIHHKSHKVVEWTQKKTLILKDWPSGGRILIPEQAQLCVNVGGDD